MRWKSAVLSGSNLIPRRNMSRPATEPRQSLAHWLATQELYVRGVVAEANLGTTLAYYVKSWISGEKGKNQNIYQ